MRVLVCGATGCVGSAVTRALRARGHEVVEGARGLPDGPRSMSIDFTKTRTPDEWARRLAERDIDRVVNCVGILMPSRGQTFERVHTAGPIELFRGAAQAGVGRIVQVSALGVGGDVQSLATPYLYSKLLADEALTTLAPDFVVLRPSLIYGPRSQSAALFATLASLPVIGLPGRGRQPLQPIHVFEVAEVVTRLLEQGEPIRAALELGGGEVLTYREMLSRYRTALGLGDALWVPVPIALMKLGAWMAESAPQKVFSRDTIRLLERGNVPAINMAPALLGRAPTGMTEGLAVVPPRPGIDLRVELNDPVAMALRVSLAFMWLYTSAVSALLPHESSVIALLGRCGFEGQAAWLALAASCALNTGLGVMTLWRPAPWTYALQCGAVLGYTFTAAMSMPALAIDHCGPLVKNLPVLMAIAILWLNSGRLRGTRERGRPAAWRTAPAASRTLIERR